MYTHICVCAPQLPAHLSPRQTLRLHLYEHLHIQAKCSTIRRVYKYECIYVYYACGERCRRRRRRCRRSRRRRAAVEVTIKSRCAAFRRNYAGTRSGAVCASVCVCALNGSNAIGKRICHPLARVTKARHSRYLEWGNRRQTSRNQYNQNQYVGMLIIHSTSERHTQFDMHFKYFKMLRKYIWKLSLIRLICLWGCQLNLYICFANIVCCIDVRIISQPFCT